MNRLNRLLVCACLASAGGCAYRGAVYSEYNQTALDIRATQASSAPIKVNFGYDRGVLAYVPKRNNSTNSTQGEAVSIISWNNVAHEVNPNKLTNDLLRVDAGFISGIAANVASAPEDAEVVIHSDLTTAKSVARAAGSPGSRIAIAVAPGTTFGQDVNTVKIRAWLRADPTHKQDLKNWLNEHNLQDFGISNVLNKKMFSPARQDIVNKLNIK